MSEETANLSLPYILPSQSQKHVTHNEALQRLDAVVQLVIADEASAPPDDAAEGACYVVGAGATLAWAGKTGLIALRQDGAWIFIEPRPGWRAWFAPLSTLHVFADGFWRDATLPASGSMLTLGINATADDTNRLAVAAPATLFNNAGSDHRIKVNKASPGDTASLLFQTGWSGRAEMGIAGDDGFSVKVSPDGSNWRTGLSVSPEGFVTMPNRPVARAGLAASTLSPASGSQTGFTDLAVSQGGFALGPSLGGAAGNSLVVPVTGLYMLQLDARILSSGGNSISLVANGTAILATIEAPPATSPLRQCGIGLAAMSAGDSLTLLHSGTAQIEFGADKTGVVAILL